MKNTQIITIIFLFGLLLLSGCSKESMDDTVDLIQIQETELAAKNSKNIDTGFNEYGFNWNAHHFNGILLNVFFSDTMFEGAFFYGWDPYMGDDATFLTKYPIAEFLPFWNYRHVNLVMHWNEALISRQAVYAETWFNSNAFITFHYSGVKGDSTWSQFQKMVAANDTDYVLEGKWYNENDEEIGIESGYTDLVLISVKNTGTIPSDFYDEYHSPKSSGLGKYKVR